MRVTRGSNITKSARQRNIQYALLAQLRPINSKARFEKLSKPGPIKSDTVLPKVRHRCDISSKGAGLPGRNDAEMGATNSLHASVYSEYNERFELI